MEEIENMFSEDKHLYKLMSELGIDIEKLENEFEEYGAQKLLEFKRLNDDVKIPTYAYPSDSGFDLYSTEEIIIEPFGRALIPTGIALNIPDGYEIQVRSKSGLALNQGLMVLNSPGTVDNGYQVEIKVILFNTNPKSFTIAKNMKVAQAVLCPVLNGKWVNLVERTEFIAKDRHDKGFGSTGI